jgi:hypothetical protein
LQLKFQALSLDFLRGASCLCVSRQASNRALKIFLPNEHFCPRRTDISVGRKSTLLQQLGHDPRMLPFAHVCGVPSEILQFVLTAAALCTRNNRAERFAKNVSQDSLRILIGLDEGTDDGSFPRKIACRFA